MSLRGASRALCRINRHKLSIYSLRRRGEGGDVRRSNADAHDKELLQSCWSMYVRHRTGRTQVSILRRTRLSCSRVYSRGVDSVASTSWLVAGREFGGFSGPWYGMGAFSRGFVDGAASSSLIGCDMSNKTQTLPTGYHGIS